jgi:hypothetical protein
LNAGFKAMRRAAGELRSSLSAAFAEAARKAKELGDTLSSLGGKLTLGEASATRLGST